MLIHRCLAEVAGRAAGAGVVAAYPQGGGPLWSAASALTASLKAELDSDIQAHPDGHARWVESTS